MRVQMEEWQRFIPGVRMYKGKKTLFYNGEKLWDWNARGLREYLIYNKEERHSLEVIIILPGVEVIPEWTFDQCSVERVIMSDSVQRIEEGAFAFCINLAFVKLSTDLEYIGIRAFCSCVSLTSIFIPPSCREIGDGAFYCCKKLIILSFPQHTELGRDVIHFAALHFLFPIENYHQRNAEDINNHINDWIKNINNGEEFALHRACSSFNPLEEVTYGIVQRSRSLDAFKRKNSIGITPAQYLEATPSLR
ncbi:hypothetical protein CTEN210_00849 [Chaetoceros tenuissimus]|uniref:Leucine-rich repeat domain-containing protein n=1 Tax=Chaetoceros tenuissimus TaxID=426638 RepID=A0AAD3GZ49_9STRA|nr:hypothetical protein CTEN210_00849 [Chaetoceros tenuissimus]